MMKKIFCALIILIMVLILTDISFADHQFSVKENEVVNSDLFKAGERVENKGVVNGDIFVCGNRFENLGHVLGDIIFITRSSIIEGRVDGDVRAATRKLTLSGEISKNVTVFCEEFLLEREGVVDGSIHVFAEDVVINSMVGGDVRCKSDRIKIDGIVKGDVFIEGNKIEFGPSAKIDGNLIYIADEKMDISKEVVTGRIEYKESEDTYKKEKVGKWLKTGTILSKSMELIGYSIIGLFINFLFTNFVDQTVVTMNEKPWYSLGIGVIGLFFIPIVVVLMMITVVGIPLGLISLFLYIGLIYLAGLPAALWIGKKILKDEKRIWVTMLLGIVILFIGKCMPFIGPIISFVTIVFGMGSYLVNTKEMIQRSKNIDLVEKKSCL